MHRGRDWFFQSGGSVASASEDITFVLPLPTFEAVYFTPFGSLGLPTEVDVLTAEGGATVGVTWAQGTYDETVEDATYTLEGTLINLPEGITNSQNLKAFIDVHVNFYDDSAETPTPALHEATGTLVPSVSGADISVAWPAGHVAYDIGVLFLEQTTADAAITTIPGWTQMPLSPSEQPVGSTQTRLTRFMRRATSNAEANVVVGSADHICGVILTYRGCSRHPLILSTVDVSVQSSKETSNTACSIAGLSNNQNGCDITYAASRGSDVATARYSNPANANLTDLTERVDAGTGDGNGGGLGIWTGNLEFAGDSGTFTADIASNTSEAYASFSFKGVNNFAAPSVQASDLTFHGDRRVDWTKQGAGTLILYNEGGAINGSFLPVDGEVYEEGDVLGGGNTVMYVGSAASAFKFTRFSYNTTVAIRAFAFNLNGADPLYNLDTAVDNPITPTTPSDPVYYLGDAITESERDDPHPEVNLRGASKAYALKTYVINGYRIVFYVMDNNASGSIYGATLAKYDQIYMLYQLEADDPRDPAAWTRFEVAGVPWPILPSDGNVPSGGNWHIGQNWIAGMRIVSDPDEVWIYVSAQGSNITSNFNFGRAVVDFTDFPASAPTVVYDAAALIPQTTNQDSFQGGDVIYHSGISRYVALIPNRASLANGTVSNGRADTAEIWLSADGLAWSKIENDIFADTPIGWGGWIIHGNAWIDTDRIHFIGTEGDIFQPRSSDASPTNTIYKYLNNKVNEYSFAISLTEVTDLRIENVLWEGDFSGGEFGVWPSSGYIDYGGEQHVIVSCANTQGLESGPGQVPTDIRVLTTSPRTGAVVVNKNAYRPGLTRYMRVSRCSVSQASAAGTTNDTIGDPVPAGAPYCEVTEALGTIHGTPTIFLIDAATLPTASDYFSFASHTHDVDNVAVKTTFFTSDYSDRGIAEKSGTFMIWLDADGKLRVRVYRTGGYMEVQSVANFNTLNTPMFADAHWAGFIWDNGTLKLCAGCTTDVPVTVITDTGSGGMIQNANAIKLGNVAGVASNTEIITAQTWYEGAEATEATWLKCNYN